MKHFDFPNIELKTKIVDGVTKVFDLVRKKYLVLTKEEFVRQHFIKYIHLHKGYPIGLIGVEKTINYNGMKIRADIIVYNNHRNNLSKNKDKNNDNMNHDNNYHEDKILLFVIITFAIIRLSI